MIVNIEPQLPTLAAYAHFIQFQPRSHAWTSWVKSLAANFKIAAEDVKVEFVPMDVEQGRDDLNRALSRLTNIIDRAPELQDDFAKLADAVAAADNPEELLLLLPEVSKLSATVAAYPRAGISVAS